MLIFLRHQSNVCFDRPPLVISGLFGELVDNHDLLTINLESVSSDAVEDEHLAVRVGFSLLLEVDADLVDDFLVFDVCESDLLVLTKSNLIFLECL